MDLRDKDIEFFLELDIPSGSEDGFCESDDDIDGANNEYDFDELLQNNEDTEIFQQEIKETLDRWDAVQLDNDMHRQHTDTVEQNTDLYIFDTFPEPSFVPQRPTRSTATYQRQNYDINLSPPTELPVQPPNVPNINVHDSSVTSLEVPSITPVTAVPQITKVPCRTPITANNVRRNNVWTAGKDNLLADHMPIFSGNSETNINPKNETPYSYFTEIFTDEMFEHIRIETIRYAVENGNAAFTMCMNELKKYFAINIAMTYIKYPYVRMYWSSLPGMRQNMIADAMTSKRFSAIKSNLHFEDNSKKPNLNTPHEKYWKLRPIINLLHKSFHSAFDPEEHICVDEMIIPFKGRSSMKQYIKAKPKKWGFKVWVQANRNGYVNCFDLYQGKSINEKFSFGPIGDTVLKLCHASKGKNHKLFMDNLFTSLPLLRELRTMDIYVIGTLRINRATGVQNYLVDTKSLQRGWSTLATTDDNITVLRWLDTKPVHTVSTYAGALPEDTVKRYDRKLKQKIDITRPFAIQEYNKFMGGVDMMDRMIAHYPHGFKNKKWYLRVFFHMLNMAIVNSWLLYRKDVDNTFPLLNFKASIVWTMLELGKGVKRGRKSPSNKNVVKKKRIIGSIPELRYDGDDHYPTKVPAKQAPRCRNINCRSRTRYICDKCNVPVCPECMRSFHTKTM